ncbi:glycosyltransferase family protein [Peristeroidobacter soli]|uniref:glycosyltransferase family 1 protein n=1 Tax=Peristeroidobacter soli TaxID=2497877 RepID=UPI00101CE736|nr:glycosyltransferase family 1 protein [Peristeroidobacter soli]
MTRKFVLIDHSMRDLGGHYYTYASCVLPAAERASLQPVLAMHREFRDLPALPPSWQSHPIFRNKSYSQRYIETGNVNGALGGWWSRTRSKWRARERQRLAESFAEDCATLFTKIELTEGDHVFFASASEIDLEGLAIFLQRAPAEYRRVHWHLQFHLGIFEGRDPEYAKQRPRREFMREIFRHALARVPEHHIHLYCTTRELTAQYEYLGVAPFHTLPYPVHPLFLLPTPPKTSSDNVRIACLGHSRREKGYRELPIVVRRLWNEYLSKGRAQLVMQTRRRDLMRALDSTVSDLGPHSATPPIVYAPFPLDLERYAELVRSSDIGLLLYDSTRYYSRCSGVLLEMLSAGNPVIVPGGCWLSEQIHEENQRHLRDIAARGVPLKQIGSADGAAISFTNVEQSSELDLTAGARSLLLRLRWLQPSTPGTYAHVELEQLDEQGAQVMTFAAIIGPGSDPSAVYSLFHLHENARRARLKWRNAWDDGPITVDSLEYRLYAEHYPAGSVGLTAANMDQSGELLGDVLLHMDHYRQRSAAFAGRCAEYFNADQIVAQLLGATSTAQPLSQPLAGRLDFPAQTNAKTNAR